MNHYEILCLYRSSVSVLTFGTNNGTIKMKKGGDKKNMIYKFNDEKIQINNPQAVAKVCQDLLNAEDEINQDKEHFWAIHVDTRHVIKLVELVSLGTLNASLVSPREVFTRAVGERSCSIIVAHNHPSGQKDPSAEDLKVTKQLVQAGEILDIKVIDHLIITKTDFLSFKENGLM